MTSSSICSTTSSSLSPVGVMESFEKQGGSGSKDSATKMTTDTCTSDCSFLQNLNLINKRDDAAFYGKPSAKALDDDVKELFGGDGGFKSMATKLPLSSKDVEEEPGSSGTVTPPKQSQAPPKSRRHRRYMSDIPTGRALADPSAPSADPLLLCSAGRSKTDDLLFTARENSAEASMRNPAPVESDLGGLPVVAPQRPPPKSHRRRATEMPMLPRPNLTGSTSSISSLSSASTASAGSSQRSLGRPPQMKSHSRSNTLSTGLLATISNPTPAPVVPKPKHHQSKSLTATAIGNLFSGGSSSRLDSASLLDQFFIKLETSIQTYGKDHPKTILVWNNIGNLQFKQRQYNEALKSYLEALRGYRGVYGENHEMVALTLINIGTVQWRLNNMEQALDCFQGSYMIRKEKLGPNDIKTAEALHQIGQVCCLMGPERAPQAIEALEQALRIRKSYYNKLCKGGNHIDIARTLGLLANAHIAVKNYGPAMAISREAFEMKCTILGCHHSSSVYSMLDMAHLYRLMEDLQASVNMYGDALKVQRILSIKALPEEVPLLQEEMGVTLNTMGMIYLQMRNLEEAERSFQAALSLYKAAGLVAAEDRRVQSLKRQIESLQMLMA